MQTDDLFSDQTPGYIEYLQAFEAWLDDLDRAGRIRTTSSRALYRDMWLSFAAWATGHNPALRLDNLTAEHLESFTATRRARPNRHDPEGPAETSARYRLRLLRLIDRVLEHRNRARRAAPGEPNAAAALIESDDTVHYADVHPARLDYLRADEAKRLVLFLSQARPRGRAAAPAQKWQELRDRASVALQLGGGLTPGEIRAARTEHLQIGGGVAQRAAWKIYVPASPSTPDRDAPIAPWAGQLLNHWCEVRASFGIPGSWLFPSTAKGTPWGKVAQYTAAQRVLTQAQIDDVKGGSFRLRHTYVIRQLRHRLARARADERAAVIQRVAEFIGVTEPKVMRRYVSVLTAPEDVV